jgi:hypothetical protein
MPQANRNPAGGSSGEWPFPGAIFLIKMIGKIGSGRIVVHNIDFDYGQT